MMHEHKAAEWDAVVVCARFLGDLAAYIVQVQSAVEYGLNLGGFKYSQASCAHCSMQQGS